MGRQLGGVVSEMTVRIIRGVRISEGQIIRAILYLVYRVDHHGVLRGTLGTNKVVHPQAN